MLLGKELSMMASTSGKLPLLPVASQMGSDFVAGARLVHDSYLTLYARQTLVYFAFRLCFLWLQDKMTNTKTGVKLLLWLRKAILAVGTWTGVLHYWVDEVLIGKAVFLVESIIKVTSRVLRFSSVPVRQTNKSSKPWLSIVGTVTVVPVTEEIVFRWFWGEVGKHLFQKRDNCLDHYPEDKENPNQSASSHWLKPWLFGHSPWTVAISALFGLSHLANYVDKLDDLRIKPDAKGLNVVRGFLDPFTKQARKNRRQSTYVDLFDIVCQAMPHTLDCFLVSLDTFEPAYKAHGLIAAIAAHAVENLYIHSEQIIVPLLLGHHAIKSLLERTSTKLREARQNKNKNDGEELSANVNISYDTTSK